jgi:uncharacterized protein (DUF433 family)
MTGFTPSQAAALTGLPLSAVRKALDHATIPSRLMRSGRTMQRMVPREALLCLKLEQLGVGRLPLAHRKRIYRSVLAQPAAREWRESEAVVIRAEAARASLNAEIEKLRLAEERVHSAPEILNGTPVLKGTRIPVHLIAEMRRQGASIEEILDGYRGITGEDVALAVFYAQAHPRRGAKLRSRLPSSAKLVRQQRILAADVH